MPEGDTKTAEVSVVNADGSFSENWSEKYGEENQAHLSRYKDFDALVNSHIATKKKFGKNPDTLVEIPTETSSDEVRAAWAKAHNVPEALDGYEYALSDEFVTKLGPLDDKKMLALREYARSKNWSPSDFKDNLDFYHTMMAGDIDAAAISFEEQKAAAADTATNELKKKWLGDYDSKVLRANAVLRKYGGEDAVASFNAQNSPLMAEFLDNIAAAMSESTLKGLAPSTPTSGDLQVKINDVREQMDKIMSENPINFKANLKYKELIERKRALYEQKNKQKSA